MVGVCFTGFPRETPRGALKYCCSLSITADSRVPSILPVRKVRNEFGSGGMQSRVVGAYEDQRGFRASPLPSPLPSPRRPTALNLRLESSLQRGKCDPGSFLPLQVGAQLKTGETLTGVTTIDQPCGHYVIPEGAAKGYHRSLQEEFLSATGNDPRAVTFVFVLGHTTSRIYPLRN